MDTIPILLIRLCTTLLMVTTLPMITLPAVSALTIATALHIVIALPADFYMVTTLLMDLVIHEGITRMIIRIIKQSPPTSHLLLLPTAIIMVRWRTLPEAPMDIHSTMVGTFLIRMKMSPHHIHILTLMAAAMSIVQPIGTTIIKATPTRETSTSVITPTLCTTQVA